MSKDEEVKALIKGAVEIFDRLGRAYNNSGVQNQLAETADQTFEDYDV